MRTIVTAEPGDADRPDVEIRILGGLQVSRGGVALPLRGQRRLCLLAVLLLNHGHTVTHDELAAWAWPSEPPDTVHRQIANYLSALRRMLAPAGDRIQLTARKPGFRAVVEPGLLDAERFASLVRRARGELAAGERQLAADRLSAALALWQGRPLDGLDTPFLRGQARRLESERRDAVLLLAGLLVEDGYLDQATEMLREQAARLPDDDAVTALLVRTLTSAGHGNEAAELAVGAERAAHAAGRVPDTALRQAHSDALAGRGVAPSAARPAGSGPRHQLPADTGAFAGRERELAELVRMAKQAHAGQNPGTLPICALDGMAGVGKTALAVHAGHLLLDLFPDGQLVVDLHGHTEGSGPRDPADALAALLRSLGVPPAQLPPDLADRAAMYRDRLAGSRTLILLDNAADEAQVRPLLPASDRCLVLVTSRRRLKALDDAQVLPVDVLPVADATALFRHVAGLDRVPANDPLLDEILALCGRLPLALRIAAAIIRNRPNWPLRRLVETLRAAPASLAAFSDGIRSLTAVFDLSYRALRPAGQRAYRIVGMIPGSDIDAAAAAALLGTSPAEAERTLQELVDDNLLAEPVPGRYRMHDLLRLHARTSTTTERPAASDPIGATGTATTTDTTAGVAAVDDAAGDRETAVRRLLDYYADTARRANVLISRHTRRAPTGSGAWHALAFDTVERARDWLRAERANIEACLAYATERRQDRLVVALTTGLAELLRVDGPWLGAADLLRTAARAARRCGDLPAEASLLADLGNAQRLAGDYPAAGETLAEAFRRHDDLDDDLGRANTLTDLGIVHRLSADYPAATEAVAHALRLFRAVGDVRGQADALAEVGAIHQATGDFPAAIEAFTESLDLQRDIGDQRGRAHAHSNLALMHRVTGDYASALRDLAAARALFEDIGDRRGQANTLTDLGMLRRLTGDLAGATTALAAALLLYRQLDDRYGQAIALTEQGIARGELGERENAVRDIADALTLFRDLGSRGGEACALNHYAAAIAATGDVPTALATYRDALRMAREVHQPDDEALALEGIGACLERLGDRPAGVEYLRQAADIYTRLGMLPDIERLQARLRALEG